MPPLCCSYAANILILSAGLCICLCWISSQWIHIFSLPFNVLTQVMNKNYKQDRVKNKSLWQGDKINTDPFINPFGLIQPVTKSPPHPHPILLLAHSTTSCPTGNTGDLVEHLAKTQTHPIHSHPPTAGCVALLTWLLFKSLKPTS